MTTKPFRVVIAGTRTFSDYGLLCRVADSLLRDRHPDIIIISGECRGADKLGEQYAGDRGYPVERFPADWKTLGRSAGPIRNRQMAEACDGAIVFWDGHSQGTKTMIGHCRDLKKSVRVVRY